jgi:peptidoglycan/LPS O-acetylase OafA/YrhL
LARAAQRLPKGYDALGWARIERLLAAAAGDAALRLPRFGPFRSGARVTRAAELDGLRGWAALVVVCFHMFWETFGIVNPVYRSEIAAVFLQGPLAVAIFFVLSGEALSIPFFFKGKDAVFSLSVKRYPRLTVPIVFNSIVIWLVVKLGLNFNGAAGTSVQRPEWLGSWIPGDLTIGQVLRFSLLDVFRNRGQSNSLDPFLWTMHTELVGSVVVFALLLLMNNKIFGYVYLIAVFVVLMVAHLGFAHFRFLGCFVAGIIFAGFRCSDLYENLVQNRIYRLLSLVLFALIVVSAGILFASGRGSRLVPIFAIVIVFCVSTSLDLRRLATSRASIFLGRISFPLFLIQFPVIISITSALILVAGNHITTMPATMTGGIAALSVVVTLVAATLFEPVERITGVIGNRVLAVANAARVFVSRRVAICR